MWADTLRPQNNSALAAGRRQARPAVASQSAVDRSRVPLIGARRNNKACESPLVMSPALCARFLCLVPNAATHFGQRGHKENSAMGLLVSQPHCLCAPLDTDAKGSPVITAPLKYYVLIYVTAA